MFWRADNPDIQGTGIGLVIAREIVEGHGGEIRLNSVLGEGTTVTLDIPLKRAALSGDSDSDEASAFEKWAA
jgi:signal transduction histidine kinase